MENATCNTQQPGATAEHQPPRRSTCSMIRMEVASSRPDHLPTLSAAKTSKLYVLVKSPFGTRILQPLCYTDQD